MTSRFRIRLLDVMIVLGIAGYIEYWMVTAPPKPALTVDTFAAQVDLSPLYVTAVHADGRLRSFESHAKTFMGFVTGPRRINGQSNGYTYLDLMFRPATYEDVDLIYVKNKNVRAELVTALQHSGSYDDPWTQNFMDSGLISRSTIARPECVALLQRLGQDLIRTSKAVDAIQSAMAVSSPGFLLEELRLIPSPDGDDKKPWLSPGDLLLPAGAPQDAAHAGAAGAAIAGMDESLRQALIDSWNGLRQAWLARNATGANKHIAALASVVPTIAPSLYPSQGRLSWESLYFRLKGMTWVWILYLLSVIPLLMSVIYKWNGARVTGLVLFVVAFVAQTLSLGVRWYVSGRWPNSNMFEAVTTSAWFGGVGAMFLEYVVRKTPFRNLFALSSAVVSMVALMAAYFLPTQLDSSINNKMAALNDVWLYIHTNVIIWSYAIIGLACIPALLLLRDRWCLAWDNGTIPKARLVILPIALAVANYTGLRLLMHFIDNVDRGLSQAQFLGVAGACWGSLMIILLEGSLARARRTTGVAKLERSASGGASALILGAGSRGSGGFLEPNKPTAGQVFDGATMVLVELSFIMLWTGLVMGAIWADHSWGRPWGWDPKEVFALNTFLIFLVLIHVRMKVRDKAFWTAILAIIGFEVMMFNWIVVNFVITGLHSYA